jgi:hypothetical protein
LYPQNFSDAGGNFLLDSEAVAERPVVAVRPQLTAAGGIEKVDGNPQLVARFADAALQQRLNGGLASDAETLDATQRVGDLFGEPIAKPGLIAFPAKVDEGADGDRPWGPRRSFSTAGEPSVQLLLEGVNGAEFLMTQSTDGQAFRALPALHSPRPAPQIGGDFLP